MIKTFEAFNSRDPFDKIPVRKSPDDIPVRNSPDRIPIRGIRLKSVEKYEKKYTEGIVCYGGHGGNKKLKENISLLIAFLAGYDIEYIFDELPTDSYKFDFLTEWPSRVSEFGANRKKLLENLEQIISPDEDWDANEATEGLIEQIEKYMTREELYNMLKTLIEQSDDRCDRVYFAWTWK